MSSRYKVARRSFLAAVGGAFGLHTLLGNLEAAAVGAPPPPRFLMMFWPVGTVHYHFIPQGSGTSYTPSRILQPFEDAGLRDDMTVLYGLTHQGMQARCGGSPEAGVVLSTTGADSPGTRDNGGEPDDAVAGGPSFDQIFLNRVPELQRSGTGYANAIGDARVDSNETSSRCLSYGHVTRSIAAARAGTDCTAANNIVENVPLLPTLSPLDLYVELFGGFMPGDDPEALKAALLRRQSVLDFALDELARMKTLAPAEQGPKIEQHAEVVRRVEAQLAKQLDQIGDVCALSNPPDASLVGREGSQYVYENASTSEPEDILHAQVGAAHMGLIRAAFQCDLIRVATFQWSAACSQVSFGGLYPEDPEANLMHHPMSHRVTNSSDVLNEPPADGPGAAVVEYLTNVHTWYNTQTAALLQSFKDTLDVHGGNLLDHTIVPFVTDIAHATHQRDLLPALIFGGKALGMRGGQYLDVSGRPHNDLWMTVAQAYLQTNDPLPTFAEEAFVQDNVGPIAGIWAPP